MSTDTRDALAAELEAIATAGELIPDWRDTLTEAARLLREDGERETEIRTEVRAEFEQESRYHQGDIDMAEARGYVRGKSEVVRTPPAAPNRAALSALYLEAHRAGVEAAADWLRAHWWVHANSALMGARDELMAQAREHLTSDGAWTDPGSPLAAFSAARENGNEAQPAPLAWLRYPDAGSLKTCPVCGRTALEGEAWCSQCGAKPTDDVTWRGGRTRPEAPEWDASQAKIPPHMRHCAPAAPEVPNAAADVLAKLEAAERMVDDLCKLRGEPGAREWTMSIPARPDHDPDLVIGDALHAARRLILAHPDAGSEARERVAEECGVTLEDAWNGGFSCAEGRGHGNFEEWRQAASEGAEYPKRGTPLRASMPAPVEEDRKAARELVARIAWDKSEEIYEEHDRTAWEDIGDHNRAEMMELADRILAALRGEEVGNG